MRFFLAILLFISPVILKAQKADSVINNAQSSLDTLQQTVSVPSNLNTNIATSSLSDSLKSAVTDSLDIVGKIVEAPNKVDSTQKAIKGKIKDKSGITAINQKVDSVQNKIETKISSLKDSVNSRFNTDFGSGGDDLGLPKEELPEMGGKVIPDMNLDINDKLIDDSILEDIDLENKGIDDLDISELDKIESLELGSKLDQAGSALGDVEEIKKGNYDSLSNAEAVKKLAIKEVQDKEILTKEAEQLETFDLEQKQLMDQMTQYQDEDYIENQLKDQAIQLSNQQLPINPTKISSAQKKLGKYKNRIKSLERSDQLPDKLPNPLADKKLGERIVIGLGMQVLRSENVEMDFSPTIAYRIWDDIDIALGGIYRLNLGKDGLSPKDNSAMYGIRSYGNWKYKKGIYAQIEFERHRMWVPTNLLTEERNREWVNNVNIGIGKRSKIKSTIRSYIIGLFNITYDAQRSPYNNKVLVRFGVEGLWSSGKRK